MNFSGMSCPDRCGDCCQNIKLPLGFIADENDIRWIEYHGIKVENNEVIINNPCSKLIDNKCSIYDNRPEICQIFICQK